MAETDHSGAVPPAPKELRDHFAGQALVGLLTCRETRGLNDAEITAQWAYRIADAMMEERGKDVTE